MVDPVSSSPIRPIAPLTSAPGAQEAPAAESGGFAGQMRRQLETVSRMQDEADAGVQRLVTGESANMTEVFVTARKAEVAFGLLMEIRNKLVEAYEEFRNMRV